MGDREYEDVVLGDEVGDVEREAGDRGSAHLAPGRQVLDQRARPRPAAALVGGGVDTGEEGLAVAGPLGLVSRCRFLELGGRLGRELDREGHPLS